MSAKEIKYETIDDIEPGLFSRHDLLSEYSKRIRSQGKEAMQLALMNRSAFFRDVFAYAATKEQYDAGELLSMLENGSIGASDLRYDWLHYLGRLIALQNLYVEDTSFALLCLSSSTEGVSLKSIKVDNVKLRIELHAERREFEKASALLTRYEDLLGQLADSYKTDLTNPFVNPLSRDVTAWLSKFNEPFLQAGLAELYLDPGATSPFNRIRSDSNDRVISDEPLVSVVMTSYAPDADSLELAARSILEQSWQNLELIVVDDATPGGPPALLETIAESDSRVKVIALQENRGTYYARNVGLKAAQGKYVTGQDSDDWSHPDRIQLQVMELLENPEYVGVVGQAIRADEQLFRIIRGVGPRRTCEVSLMFPADIAREIGGYIEARKAADSEFRFRLELYADREVKVIEKPIYLTRLSRNSLSRGEFAAGWAHPNRRAFLSFMHHWHKHSSPEGLALPPTQGTLHAIPPKFRSVPMPPRSYNYVFATDWRYDSARTRSALVELETLRERGRSVAIMQLGGLFPHASPLSRLLPEVQKRISNGDLDLVIPDEEAQIGCLIVKGPELIQFAGNKGFTSTAAKVLIVADVAASARDGSEPIYNPKDCSQRAIDFFGVKPIWTTQDPGILQYFREFFPSFVFAGETLPFVLPDMSNREQYVLARNRRMVPIISTIGKNIENQWPQDVKTAQLLWPSSKTQGKVQLFGSIECYLRRYDQKLLPKGWRHSFANGPADFYFETDYFVYYPDYRWPQTISYEAFVAYAYGAIVILPDHFREHHEGMAILMEPADAANFIQTDWSTGKALSLGNSKQAFEIDTNAEAFVETLESPTFN